MKRKAFIYEIIGLLHGYGLIKRGFKSRLGWRPWEPS